MSYRADCIYGSVHHALYRSQFLYTSLPLTDVFGGICSHASLVTLSNAL